MSQNGVRLQPSLRMTVLKQSNCHNVVRSQHSNRNSSSLPSYWPSAREVLSNPRRVQSVTNTHVPPTSYVIFVRVTQCAGAVTHAVM